MLTQIRNRTENRQDVLALTDSSAVMRRALSPMALDSMPSAADMT